MINIRFWEEHEGSSTIHMTVKGHAHTAPKGQDLVCAAATMLAYTAAQAMDTLYKQGKLVSEPRIKIRKGKCAVSVEPYSDSYEEVKTVFWTVQCGGAVLAANYPGAVALTKLSV